MLAVLGATLVGSEESASVSVEDSELLNARIELSVDVGDEVVLILELFAGQLLGSCSFILPCRDGKNHLCVDQAKSRES
jgi:hypothetical protein